MAKQVPHEDWPETWWWQRVEWAEKTSGDGPAFRKAWRRSKQSMSAGILLRWLLRHVLGLKYVQVVMVLQCRAALQACVLGMTGHGCS